MGTEEPPSFHKIAADAWKRGIERWRPSPVSERRYWRTWRVLFRRPRYWTLAVQRGLGHDRRGYYWSTSWGPLMVRQYEEDVCEDCGQYPRDRPSRRCTGCDAYQEHLDWRD